MAELALGVMGVIPLLGIAYKSYRSVYTTLKAFRHSSNDLENIHKRLKLSRDYFQLECCLLLRFALDEESIDAMRADLNHANWSTLDLESRLRSSLSSGYETCEVLAESINRSLKQFEEEMRRFDGLETDPPEGERRGDTIRRIQKRAQIAFNKSKYESICKDLRDANIDLTSVREQISEIQYPRSRRPVPRQKSRGDWGAICRVRGVSTALYQGFHEAWSCGHESHTSHSLKILLDFEKSKQTSDLSIAIVGENPHADAISHVAALQVCSERLWGNLSLPTPSPSPSNRQTNTDRPRKKMKIVRFAEPTASSSHEFAAASPVEQQCQPRNLGNSPDICLDLSKTFVCPSSSRDCLGYLDVSSDENFRHSFYRSKGGFDSSTGVTSLNEVLSRSNLESVSVQDRLKLARTVATAALTYHSTPWLKEYWRLSDLRFLAKAKDPYSSFLSLHLDADLKRIESLEYADMDVALTPDSTGLSQASEDERLFVGINNMALHSLGVALLGIDKWRDFDPGDLAVVRKAARSSMLGPKYQDVVQRCLGCEFRYGHDLSKPKLHQAAYENVVGSLDDLVACLDVADDG